MAVRWPWCSKYSPPRSSCDDPARCGDVALLHRQDDVVVQGLGEPLDEHAVGRQARAADAEPRATHDVEHVEGHRAAVDLGQRLEVAREGRANGGGLVVLEPADPGGVGEAPPVVLDHRHRLQHPEPRRELGAVQGVEHGTLGGAEGERPLGVVRHAPVVLDLRGVGPHVARDEVVDRAVGQRLLPAQQGQAGDEAGQVPRPVPEVGLVEVVDVEDEPTVGVEVGAEVLGVQVALDPDARPVVVDPVARRTRRTRHPRRRRRRTGTRCRGRTRTGRGPSCGTSCGSRADRPPSTARRPPAATTR